MKPVLRYFGAKWALADWVISHMPPHTCYVEVFGGSAAVLLNKPRSEHEVYNDLDERVVSFFRVLRERPDDLMRDLELTPFSRRELELSFEPTTDELERARRFYVRSWQTRGGSRRSGRSSWIYCIGARNRSRPVDRWCRVEHLKASVDRLRQVMIECSCWRSILRRFDRPDTLFYLDPPYLTSTRAAKYEYRHEMDEDDHRELLETVSGLDAMVMLSGYPSVLYDDTLVGWERHTTEARAVSGGKRTECLWLNPAAAAVPTQKDLWR